MIVWRSIPRCTTALVALLLGLSTVHCRPGVLDPSDPVDPCFCGGFEVPAGAGSLQATVRSHESGALVTAVVERRGDTGNDPAVEWQAVLFSGEVTAPGVAEGHLTVLLARSEALDDYLERGVGGVVLRLEPTSGACGDRGALTLSFDYLDMLDAFRSESLALVRTAPCPY